MAVRIQTLKLGEDQILPRTLSRAVTMEDETTLQYAIENVDLSHVKIRGTDATTLGVVDGTSASDYLISRNASTSNVLAAATLN